VPEDIAPVAVFLASPAARSITGEVAFDLWRAPLTRANNRASPTRHAVLAVARVHEVGDKPSPGGNRELGSWRETAQASRSVRFCGGTLCWV
jgi:hypothetical protein